VDRSAQGVPVFDLAVCTPEPGEVATSMAGVSMRVAEGLGPVAEADLVCVPAQPRDQPVPEPVLAALRTAHARGARVMSVCTGAFVLGAAGLLDGRACTTHWMYATELEQRFPEAKVQCDVLYVDDGGVITSAGSSAGLDACLHLYRQEFGARIAAAVARRLVVPAHREGGQAQYIESPVPELTADTLQPLLEWMAAHLDEDLSIEALSARALMSPRTFARRFKAETGTTPYHWVTNQRVMRAEELLESTDETVERIAAKVGFSNATAFRHHFARMRGTTPQQYRRTFRAPTVATA
jgi:transcriptional regulator GlxA family with amidase domain